MHRLVAAGLAEIEQERAELLAKARQRVRAAARVRSY